MYLIRGVGNSPCKSCHSGAEAHFVAVTLINRVEYLEAAEEEQILSMSSRKNQIYHQTFSLPIPICLPYRQPSLKVYSSQRR